MAASVEVGDSLEELEELFLQDITDDDFYLNEEKHSSDVPVSAKDNFLCTNVNTSSLKLVLERLADPQVNCVREEQALAAIVNRVESDRFADFLTSVADLFEKCFNLRSSKKNKHLRAIELEKNFSECRTKSSLASKAWMKILQDVGIERSPACDSVFQHVLQHFWSTTGSVVEKENIQTRSSAHLPDDMESEAVTDHAGWAIKRARDIINSCAGNHLSIKKSPMASDACKIDKSVALELIAKLGNDEKQCNGHFRFVPIQEVSSFFLGLHDVVDNLLSKNQFVVEKNKVVTNCLQQLSTDQGLRNNWFSVVSRCGFQKPVEVFVLEKICLMFVKSKQQIVREKLLLKPKKGSVALREELKGKIGKASSTSAKQTTSTETVAVKLVPSVVLKLRDNFESPENVTCCLKEILQQPSKRDILLSLSGKELSKLLLALGQPGLDGKKKTRQVEVLLSSSHECIIKYPDKVDR